MTYLPRNIGAVITKNVTNVQTLWLKMSWGIKITFSYKNTYTRASDKTK